MISYKGQILKSKGGQHYYRVIEVNESTLGVILIYDKYTRFPYEDYPYRVGQRLEIVHKHLYRCTKKEIHKIKLAISGNIL